MVYRQDNRIKKNRGRYTALGIILGIGLAVGGIYVYDNYKQVIFSDVAQVKPVITYHEDVKPNPPTQITIPTKSTSQSIQDNHKQNLPVENPPIQQSTNTFLQAKQTVIDPIALEHQIHTEINNVRVENGLKPLVYDEKIATIARNHSQDMAVNNYFDHTSPDGKTLQNRFMDSKYFCFASYGENIQQNYISTPNLLDSIIQTWMTSSGHKANILSKFYLQEGLGVYVNSDNVFITEDFC